MSSYENKKDLKFIITLGTGTFGSNSKDQVIIQGFRASVNIDKAGGVQMGTLRAKIYGVKQSDMNSVTTVGYRVEILPSVIEVFAIDGPIETLVFGGNIVNAWADYANMPDVFLHIQAQAANHNMLKPAKARSFKGAVDVATVMEQISKEMGYTFENNGVNVKVVDLSMNNTNMEQAKYLAETAGIDLYLDDKTLAITPRNAPRKTLSIPEMSATSGMIGYPTFDGFGVNFSTLFNPSVTFGGLIKITTKEVQRAEGEWVVASMSHDLESQTPGGKWFTTVRGNASGLSISKR